jgi:methyltransferase (TIGR00027 family)
VPARAGDVSTVNVAVMKDGVASQTARSVAARRLTYDRLPADYGNPGADLALSRDVAAGLAPSPGRMHDYIRARTAFFDRVVVTAVTDGVPQVVVGAAGYDARSLRYARPGVRWFEVDHPATQADKLERLGRLGIDARHVQFVAADFTTDPVAAALRDAGLDPREPALFLFEGIAVYLDKPVTESVLAQFREVTVPGATLAISVSVTAAARGSAARARFAESVAAMGEPARSVLEPAEAAQLLGRAGWRLEDRGRQPGRRTAAGLLTARAVPAHSAPPPTQRTVPAAPFDRPSPVLPGPDPTALPLPALLSRALVAFTIEADNEAEHRLPHRTATHGPSPGAPPGAPWMISLAMWASSLRHVPDAGITVAGLRRAARAETNLAGIRRWGYVTFDPEPARGKQPAERALIRLTAQGRIARDGWAPVGEVAEQRWRDRFGAQAIARLRAALATITADLDPGLPDGLPILGHGLFSRLPAPGPRASSAPPREPRPPQPPAPLWSLLSRPLLAFAIEYESGWPLSLAVSANPLRVADADGVRTRDIPGLAGVSKEAVAMAMGVLGRQALATAGPGPGGDPWRVTRLTARGRLAQDAHAGRVAAIEDAWRARFGANAVAALRAALASLPEPALLAGMAPYPDGWRAQAKPITALPHYPMVLHRGGYPDGS